MQTQLLPQASCLVSGSSFVNEGLNSSLHVVLGVKQDANSSVVSWPREGAVELDSLSSHPGVATSWMIDGH